MKERKVISISEKRPAQREGIALVRDLRGLSGKQILDRILELKKSREVVEGLSKEDFYWMVKKIGEDDCLPALEWGTLEQWQYLLDLEIWKKDRPDLKQVSTWLSLLHRADGSKLVKWFLGTGRALAHYHFLKNVEVVFLDSEDDVYDLPKGFFSLDGVLHVRAYNPDDQPDLEGILGTMAQKDFKQYQNLLLGLSGIQSAELEEQMYRMRNLRLSEHGFLPFEEAISIYSHLDPNAFQIEKSRVLPEPLKLEDIQSPAPLIPMGEVASSNRLLQVASRVTDPRLLDRVRTEFAGLCNQIMSADGLVFNELDVLIKTCQKAAGYLNLALERLCGGNIALGEETVRRYSLTALFRLGFGQALNLKWEAERWVRGSWFHNHDLEYDFWGEHWGGTLTGILAKRPSVYSGMQGDDAYKEFESLSEIGDCLKILRSLMVLDGLLERLAAEYPSFRGDLGNARDITFRRLLFNLWGRIKLGLEPSFSEISKGQAKRLFKILRAGDDVVPPYRMSGFKEVFIRDFVAYASGADQEAVSILKNALSLIWEDFRKEYERIKLDNLDERYSRFITITPP